MEAVILASTPSSMDIINTMGAQPEAEPSLRGELGEVSEEVPTQNPDHQLGEMPGWGSCISECAMVVLRGYTLETKATAGLSRARKPRPGSRPGPSPGLYQVRAQAQVARFRLRIKMSF